MVVRKKDKLNNKNLQSDTEDEIVDIDSMADTEALPLPGYQDNSEDIVPLSPKQSKPPQTLTTLMNKVTEEVGVKDQAISAAIKAVEKQFGRGTIMDMGSNSAKVLVEVIPTGSVALDKALSIGGYPRGRIIEIYGNEACLDENTFIQYSIRTEDGRKINNKGGTIKRLWERFHRESSNSDNKVKYLQPISVGAKFTASCLNEEDRIFHNQITDVVKTGIQECFELTTLGGCSIVATEDHKFFTGTRWVPLKELSPGDTVLIHNNTRFTKDKLNDNNDPVRKNTRTYFYVRHHPVARKKFVRAKISQKDATLKKGYFYNQLLRSHAVVEAFMNNMTLEEYLECLNNGNLEGLKFLDKKDYVHHLDEDVTNDDIQNLVVMNNSEHAYLHTIDRHNNLRFMAVEDIISSIVPVGNRETFDLRMTSPFNNYIANNFVVHNSGKTTLALHAIAEAQRRGGRAFYVDAEHALDLKYAETLGVQTNKLLLSQPDYGEQALEIVDMMIRSTGFDIVVVDSVAALVPKAELEGDMGDSHVALQARLMSHALRKLAAVVSSTKTVIIFINQIRCVSEDTLVYTENGIEAAKTAQTKTRIAGYTGSLVSIGGHAVSSQKAKIITEKDGRRLVCGYNHPLLQITSQRQLSWTPAKDLKIGDWVAISRFPALPATFVAENNGTQKLDLPDGSMPDFIALLGVWLTKGRIRNQKLIFSRLVPNQQKTVLELGHKCGWKPIATKDNEVTFGSDAYNVFVNAGCAVRYSLKSVPPIVQTAEQWRQLIRYTMIMHRIDRGFLLKFQTELIARQIHTALLGLGINSQLRRMSHKEYRIIIVGYDMQKYIREIGFNEYNFRSDFHIYTGFITRTEIKKFNIWTLQDYLSFMRDKPYVEDIETDHIPFMTEYISQAKKSPVWYNLPPRVQDRVKQFLQRGHTVPFSLISEIEKVCGIECPVAKFRWSQIETIEDSEEELRMVDFNVPDGEAFVAEGFVTHNSKVGISYGSNEVTSGGNALKFYASVRLDIRPIGKIKEREEVIGHTARIKVVKNKLAPPFKQAEVPLIWGVGISHPLEILELATTHEIIQKSGANYTYEDIKLGLGKTAAQEFLEQNPEILAQIEKKLRDFLSL